MNPETPAGDDHVFLIGRTSLREYLHFMATEPVGPAADPRSLADEWRAASDRLFELQHIEAGWADGARPWPVPPILEPLAAEVLADPVFRAAYAVVPTAVGMVDLDRLVVSQKTIDLAHVGRLRDRLGPAPSPEQVFRLCLPFDHPSVGCRVGRVGSDVVVFASDSTDLRFLESVVLSPDQLGSFRSIGPVAGVVGLVVGFGSGYLNVIACEGRLVLNNGFHRAYALRELGVSHVPAVVQKVLRPEEVGAVGGPAFRRAPESFLKSPRPLVLKDYFDPKLCTVIQLPRRARHIRVRFTVEEGDVPA